MADIHRKQEKSRGKGTCMKRKIGNLVMVLLSLMLMCGTFTVTSSAATIPDDAIKYNGHHYKAFDMQVTWGDAKSYCESLGGHLATITSQEEQNIVEELVADGSVPSYWLGATDVEEEGKWEWITGEEWNYTHWDSGQPDNYSGENGSVENYLEIRGMYSNWRMGCWNDLQYSGDPSLIPGFICEWENGNEKISIKNASVTLSKTKYTYDGKSKIPSVKVILNSKTLNKGRDYTVTYEGASQIGTACVHIIGKGNYQDQVDKTYAILPGKVSISVSSKACAQAVISCKKVKGATGYQYFWKKKSASSYSSKTSRFRSLTLKKMTSGANYKFKVCAYTKVGNQYYYGDYSSAKTVKIFTGKSITKTKITLSKTVFTYDGKPKYPEITVKNGITKLKKRTDYTIKYRNNVNAGTASVTIIGQGKYRGTVKKTFKILPRTLKASDLSLKKKVYTYTAKRITPRVKAASSLITSADYTCQYNNCTNAGIARVTVTGKRNYTGTIMKTYTINPLSLSSCTVTLPEGGSYAYTGTSVQPAVLVKYGETVIPFQPSSTYRLDYYNNIEPGNATVTVTGTGNLTRSRTLAFQIEKNTYIWPCESAYTVTTLYYYKDGTKHSTTYGKEKSIDIGGGGNIVAIADGTVEKAVSQTTSYGKHVIIKHKDGSRSLYAHMSSLNVKQGDSVKQGDILGVMGETGNAAGVHLHFEYSNGNLMESYYKDRYMTQLIYEQNVHDNNEIYNPDKTMVKWIEAHYQKRNGYYYFAQ